MQSGVKFSSCRGVAFEIQPHESPFSVATTICSDSNAAAERSASARGRFRLPWDFMRNTSRIFPSSLQHSMSRPSSHFCDLEDDNEISLEEYLEEGKIKETDGKPVEEMVEKAIIERNVKTQPQEKNSENATARKPWSRLRIILLDQGLFTVYKRLFVISLTLNITALVLTATDNFRYGKNKAALFSIANIFTLTLCRSEAFLRIIFYLTVKILGRSFIPLCVKTAVTSVLQTLGGIHSGCAISSIAWLIYALTLTVKDKVNTSTEIIAVGSAIVSLLCFSSLAAFPLFHHLHHNVFERIHRFTGWIALGLLWAFIILTVLYDPITKSYNKTGLRLIKTQEFWFTLAITITIILPWLTVRRVPVNISSPSGHASLIKFAGGVKAGILGRISPSPLSEWHAFGIISDGKTSHMMLAGAVGDFTKSLVTEPPTHLWVRTIHFARLPYLVNLYEKVLLVATGSGICVFLSFLLQPNRANVKLLWVAKEIEKNLGREIVKMVKEYGDKDKIIVHDTAVRGRPNVSEMSLETAKKFGAEVVIVTSNPEGSRDVVSACKASGLPAFGPIWDS